MKGIFLQFPVAIEHGTTGTWYGRFVDYPGTHARAFDKQALLHELEEEIRYHISWMKKHDLGTLEILDFELIIDEEQVNIQELGESGGEVALFEFDKQLVANNQFHSFIQIMTINRSELLNLVKPLPASRLEFTPNDKSRCINEILMHICNAEEWYISRMGENATLTYLQYADMPESELDSLPVFERLNTVREACLQALKTIIPDFKLKIFKRAKFTKYPEEKWTAFKVLRRFLEHEREHFYNIRDYLGIPRRSLEE